MTIQPTDEITLPWLLWALARVDDLAKLDDPEFAPATDAAAALARALAHAISAWHVVAPKRAPQFVPDGAGGIGIVWRENGYSLDIDVEPNGIITGWLHRDADRAQVSWGDAPEAGAERICSLLNSEGNPRGYHPTCIETTGAVELSRGERSYVCGPDCPPPREDAPSAGRIQPQGAETGPEVPPDTPEAPEGSEAIPFRFSVYAAPLARGSTTTIGIAHGGCPSGWWVEVDDFSALGELNRRASEHAEVCR